MHSDVKCVVITLCCRPPPCVESSVGSLSQPDSLSTAAGASPPYKNSAALIPKLLHIPTSPVKTRPRTTRLNATMPSELETAMESLIKVFHRYASKEGRTGTLNRRELRELMENELSNFLKSQKDPAAVDKIMKDLDTNGDGQVDFEEFVSLVVGLSIASATIMSNVQQAMALLITAFDKYSGKEGDRHTLSKGELKELLANELGELLGKANDKAAVDRIFKDLDVNKDNSVDFGEFVTLVCCLTQMCH
ncbi:hypothetical protein INR49_027499, partial [Caranx melampygus]